MVVMNATDVRKNWSVTVDTVLHERPAYIKRTRDMIAMFNMQTMNELLRAYEFKASKFVENDGSITLSLDDMDLVVNDKDLKTARKSMASEIKEYAEDYYDNFAVWSVAPNRKSHIPYVMKALVLDESEIEEVLICRAGRN